MALKIYHDDEAKIYESINDFPLEKTRIQAAGGLVTDDAGRVLMIFRRGKWDLPKGKFEEGETIEQCAKREVCEETGLVSLSTERKLLITYHTYTDRKKSFLKETHWFLFRATGNQKVQPQTEEDITDIKWVDPQDLAQYTANTYGLIKDVLQAGGLDL